MSLYQFYTIQLVGASSVRIGSITQISMPQNLDIGADPTSGSPHPRVVHLRSSKPVISFTSLDVEQVLSLTGSTSLAVKSGGTYTALEVYQAKVDDCGRPLGGSVHRKLSFALGCLIPRTLNVSSGQYADISCDFLCLTTDGLTIPVTITDNVALPALHTTNNRFTVGPIVLGGITLSKVQQFSVDFGNSVSHLAFDSGVYPTHVNVDSQVVRGTFTVMAPEAYAAASLNPESLELDHSDTTVGLRAYDPSGGGNLLADTDAEHILLTFAGLATVDDALSASGNAPGQLSGSITARHDGTNAPVVIAVNQALSS